MQSFSVVIPTLDRPQELLRTLDSIAQQNLLPSEIIIVDQSKSDYSATEIAQHNLFKKENLQLNYILNPSICGLVEAKSVGVNRCTTEIVCFLEDDVVLHSNYLGALLRGFDDNPRAVGVGGIVANPQQANRLITRVSRIFQKGPFHDPRIDIFCGNNLPSYIPSAYLSGGISAWKKEVFANVTFDLDHRFHYYEDLDFSFRVNDKYPGRTLINRNALLDHIPSIINRPNIFNQQRKKAFELVRFCRAHRQRDFMIASVFWLNLGIMGLAIFELVFKLKPYRLVGQIFGLIDGFIYLIFRIGRK